MEGTVPGSVERGVSREETAGKTRNLEEVWTRGCGTQEGVDAGPWDTGSMLLKGGLGVAGVRAGQGSGGPPGVCVGSTPSRAEQ